MQLSKLSALATLALADLAAATPSRRQVGLCNIGTLMCCASTQVEADSTIPGLLALLGIGEQNDTGLIGVQCSPVSILEFCDGQLVCCTNIVAGGYIAFGCTPVETIT